MKSTPTQPIHQSKYQLQQLALISAQIWRRIEWIEEEDLYMNENPEYQKPCKDVIGIYTEAIHLMQEKYKSVFDFLDWFRWNYSGQLRGLKIWFVCDTFIAQFKSGVL